VSEHARVEKTGLTHCRELVILDPVAVGPDRTEGEKDMMTICGRPRALSFCSAKVVASTRHSTATGLRVRGPRCGLLSSAAMLGVVLAVGTAHADYRLGAYSTSSELSLTVGDEFSINIIVEGPAAQMHNSCIFSLFLTGPGIEILSYDWATPYESLSPYEYSTPGAAALPAIITPDLYVRQEAPDLNDVEFSNVVDPESGTSMAGPGRILTANMRVPASYNGATRVFIFAIPDTFANGFSEITTRLGSGVTLNIVIPAPGVVAMCGALLGGISLRRRR